MKLVNVALVVQRARASLGQPMKGGAGPYLQQQNWGDWMKQRGRPRQDATVPAVIEGSFGQRPDPPAMLTKRQRAIWLETVASEPVDFFATAALRNLLAEYCAHRETWETLSDLINASGEWSANDKAMTRYEKLLKMRELESRAAGSLAMKLRLTNQSRYSPTTAGTSSRNTLKGRKPWEDA